MTMVAATATIIQRLGLRHFAAQSPACKQGCSKSGRVINQTHKSHATKYLDRIIHVVLGSMAQQRHEVVSTT
jgi:hypothetical protein